MRTTETPCYSTLGRRCTTKNYVTPAGRRRFAADAAARAVSDWQNDRMRDTGVSSLRACTNYRADEQIRCSPGIAVVGAEEDSFRELVWANAVVKMVDDGLWVELTCDLEYSKSDEFDGRE